MRTRNRTRTHKIAGTTVATVALRVRAVAQTIFRVEPMARQFASKKKIPGTDITDIRRFFLRWVAAAGSSAAPNATSSVSGPVAVGVGDRGTTHPPTNHPH